MKISFSVLDKLITHKCSSHDINFLIYIAQFQHENGTIYNVHYKDIVDTLNINTKTYFDILNRLESKEIISIKDADKYGYRHITILNNDYTNKNYHEDTYLNINRAFFYTDEFCKMKATTKYVLFKILKRNKDNGNNIPVTDDTIGTYAGINVKNKRLIKEIIKALKEIEVGEQPVFDVFSKKGSRNKVVHHFKLMLEKGRRKSDGSPLWEKECRQAYMFKSFLKKHHIPFKDKDVEDLIQMDNQYAALHEFYMVKVKEILLQYKLEAKVRSTINFVCATVRTIVDPVHERASVSGLLDNQVYTPLV